MSFAASLTLQEMRARVFPETLVLSASRASEEEELWRESASAVVWSWALFVL